MEKNKMIKFRVWDKQGKYIGRFELPEPRPNLVRWGQKNYTYNQMHNVFVEATTYEISSLEITDVK